MIIKCQSTDEIIILCPSPAADTEDVCIVERLFSSSLVAIVSLKAPRKLKVCHFKKGTEICNYSYSNTILAVKLNRQVGQGSFAVATFMNTKRLIYPLMTTLFAKYTQVDVAWFLRRG